MIRFDYACKKCEKTFVVWSDEARRCAYCGSKRVFKVFLTAPSINTGNPAEIEKLAERQLEAAGLSNYTNANGTIRRERKTDPKMIEAIAAAKKYNVPFQTGPNGTLQSAAAPPTQIPVALGREIAARGKAKLTMRPRGTGALTSNIIERGKRFDPYRNGPYRLPKDGGTEDLTTVQKMIGR